ncbi:MAG: hypothetical protein M3R65_03215 [Gemmatimonadota bacterium]|nr:hypothetical protein [Gemmatimonadota bacterium]
MMTLSSFEVLLAQHWVVIGLVLCPVLVVMMALAALSCEACGAPFGIFRRRHRTIDLCLRCAVLHDIRRESDRNNAESDVTPSGSGTVAPAASSINGSPRAELDGPVYTTQSPVELGVHPHPAGR